MGKIVKSVCILLVFIIVFSTTAYATAIDDQRASSYFVATSAQLRKTSTGFEIWSDVTCKAIMDKIGASTIVVERSSNGSTWTQVKTYTKESYSEMVTSNDAFHTCCLTYTATAGYYYRACVTFYAKKGTGTAELDQYTAVLKL